MRFLKDRLIREIGWIVISRLIGDAEPDESHHRSHRRLFRLASSINLVTRSKILSPPLEKVGEIYLRFLWISKVKCFSPSSSILYIGRIVVLRSLVTILFHPWAWIRGLGERDSNLSVPAADVNLGGRLTTKRVEILPVIVDERWK